MKAKNRKKHLQGRMEDHSRMIASGSRENKVNLRMKTGGFHRPGSNKK